MIFEACPQCGGKNIERDEAHIGVGTIYGKAGCPECFWVEGDPLEKVLTESKRIVALRAKNKSATHLELAASIADIKTQLSEELEKLRREEVDDEEEVKVNVDLIDIGDVCFEFSIEMNMEHGETILGFPMRMYGHSTADFRVHEEDPVNQRLMEKYESRETCQIKIQKTLLTGYLTEFDVTYGTTMPGGYRWKMMVVDTRESHD